MVALWLAPTAVLAQADPQASVLWRRLAEIDSEAALALIEDNHTGARPELGDAVFQQRLALARRHVRERLPKVEAFQGYSGLMAGLAADFADGHIWSRPLVAQKTVMWTGLLLKREGQAWRVASQLEEAQLPDVRQAKLTACDGVEAEAWADARIAAFVAGEPNEAKRADAAGWLLTDDGNPFSPRPMQCDFETIDGRRQAISLRWAQGPVAFVQDRIEAADRVAPDGYSLEPWGGGYWIRLSHLDDGALAVIDAAEDAREALREAPVVVVDLRGNGGGDSSYGETLARILVGDERVDQAKFRTGGCSGAHWRASRANVAALESARGGLATRDPEAAASLDEIVAGMNAALIAGRPFWPDLENCEQHPGVEKAAAPVTAASRLTGRLVVVTDRHCFSSCLIVVDLLKRLGALQVGEATDVSSRYMEVRTIVLPSGLRNFSTLQKVAVGTPDFGPYTPDAAFPGSMSDDDSLRDWLKTLLGI